MYCEYCGHALEDTARFCPVCGSQQREPLHFMPEVPCRTMGRMPGLQGPADVITLGYFADGRYREVVLRGTELIWKNGLPFPDDPSRYPAEYFDESIVALTSDQMAALEQVLDSIWFCTWEAGLGPVGVGARAASTFTCTYRYGGQFEYRADCPNSEFQRLAEFVESLISA